MALSAWIMMLMTMLIVTSFTLYFFIKVLRTPSHSSQDQKSRPEEIEALKKVERAGQIGRPIPMA